MNEHMASEPHGSEVTHAAPIGFGGGVAGSASAESIEILNLLADTADDAAAGGCCGGTCCSV